MISLRCRPLTGLEFLCGRVFYRDIAPTALPVAISINGCHFDIHRWRQLPSPDRAGKAAFQALGGVKLGAALRALAVLEKNVERLATLAAAPEVTLQRRGMTGGTGKTFTPGHFGAGSQHAGLLKTAPAIP